MPEAWGTFYLMVGSSAGALIGLLFVVITLTGETEAETSAAGQRTFLSPTVFHFVTVLIIGSVAVIPDLAVAIMALAIAVPAAIGFFNAVVAILRMIHGKPAVPHWSDYVTYGALPAVAHGWLIASAWWLWTGLAIAANAVAFGALALLLLGIRDAWDLATWLAVRSRTPPPGAAR